MGFTILPERFMAEVVRGPWKVKTSGSSVYLSGGAHSNPLQYSCLENATDRGSWQGTVHWVSETDTTETTIHTPSVF